MFWRKEKEKNNDIIEYIPVKEYCKKIENGIEERFACVFPYENPITFKHSGGKELYDFLENNTIFFQGTEYIFRKGYRPIWKSLSTNEYSNDIFPNNRFEREWYYNENCNTVLVNAPLENENNLTFLQLDKDYYGEILYWKTLENCIEDYENYFRLREKFFTPSKSKGKNLLKFWERKNFFVVEVMVAVPLNDTYDSSTLKQKTPIIIFGKKCIVSDAKMIEAINSVHNTNYSEEDYKKIRENGGVKKYLEKIKEEEIKNRLKELDFKDSFIEYLEGCPNAQKLAIVYCEGSPSGKITDEDFLQIIEERRLEKYGGCARSK